MKTKQITMTRHRLEALLSIAQRLTNTGMQEVLELMDFEDVPEEKETFPAQQMGKRTGKAYSKDELEVFNNHLDEYKEVSNIPNKNVVQLAINFQRTPEAINTQLHYMRKGRGNK